VLSCRVSDGFNITPRGPIKELFAANELIKVDLLGKPSDRLKAPDETSLFSSLYSWEPSISWIVRVYPPFATAVSIRGGLDLSGLSLARVLAGVRAAEAPILPAFTDPGTPGGLWTAISAAPTWPLPGFLIVGGGLIVWGASSEEVEQRCELFEFLCRCATLDIERD
jgi:ribulose-5-phosphate 4-epimerase/fuculose-1-phosphate aldolase